MADQSDDAFNDSEQELWNQLPSLEGEERAQALDALGFNSFSRKEFSSAGILAEESAKVSIELNRIPEAIAAMVNASFSWHLNGDGSESIRTGLEAVKLIREHGIEKIHGNVLLKLSKCLSAQNSKNEAINAANLAVSAFLENCEFHDAGHAMAETACILEASDQIFESINMYEFALKTFQGDSLKTCCLEPMLKLTELYLLIEDYDSAQELIKNAKSLRLMQTETNDYSIRLDLLHVALLNDTHQFKDAYKIAGRQIEKIAESGETKYAAICAIELARSNFGLNEVEVACRTLYKAVRIADMNGQVENIRKALYVAESGLKEESELQNFVDFVSTRKAIRGLPEFGDFLNVRFINRLIAANQESKAANLLDSSLKNGVTTECLLDFYVLRAKIAWKLKNSEVLRILVSKVEEIANEQNLETEQKIANLIRSRLEEQPAIAGQLLDMFNYRTDEKSRASKLLLELGMMSSLMSSKPS